MQECDRISGFLLIFQLVAIYKGREEKQHNFMKKIPYFLYLFSHFALC